MAVEIKEMVIRVELEPEGDPGTPAAMGNSAIDPEMIIEACVRRVFAILNRDKER